MHIIQSNCIFGTLPPRRGKDPTCKETHVRKENESLDIYDQHTPHYRLLVSQHTCLYKLSYIWNGYHPYMGRIIIMGLIIMEPPYPPYPPPTGMINVLPPPPLGALARPASAPIISPLSKALLNRKYGLASVCCQKQVKTTSTNTKAALPISVRIVWKRSIINYCNILYKHRKPVFLISIIAKRNMIIVNYFGEGNIAYIHFPVKCFKTATKFRKKLCKKKTLFQHNRISDFPHKRNMWVSVGLRKL